MQIFNLNISAFIDKINDYAIFIISFLKTTFNNIIAIRNINFQLGNILNSSGIIIQFILSILYILIFITCLVFLGSIFNIIKEIIKWFLLPFKLISWMIAKIIIKLIFNSKSKDIFPIKNINDDKITKELLILRLQNGKLKKQLNQSENKLETNQTKSIKKSR